MTAKESKHRFLVQWEYIETGLGLPTERVPDLVRGTILPSLHMCAQWEKQKKILGGGVFAGARSSAIIIEAESHSELSRMLQSLPFWSIMKFDVRPLQSFEDRADQEGKAADFVERMLKSGPPAPGNAAGPPEKS